METTEIILPDIAKDCPLIQSLFHPDKIDDQIERTKKLISDKFMIKRPGLIKGYEKELLILQDWKKQLDGEITLDEYNELHQLIDLK